MSIKAMNWAFSLPLKPNRKVVLLALADSADDQGYCFPAHKTLATKSSVSVSTVKRVIGDLAGQGLLSKTNRKSGKENKSNLYRLNLGVKINSENTNETPTPSGQNEPTPSGQNEPTPSGQNEPTPSGQNEPTPSGQNEPTSVHIGEPVTISNLKKSHTVTHACGNEDSGSIATPEDFDRRFGQQDTRAPERTRKFAMFNQWQPDQTFTEQARLLGVDLSTLDSDQQEQMEYALVEFRTWWQDSNPNYIATQRVWQQKFIQTSLKRFLNNAVNNNKNAAGGNHGQRNHSSRPGHSGSPTTRPFTAEDFDLNASW